MSKSEYLPSILRRRSRRMTPAKIKIKGIQGNVVSFGSPGPTHLAWRKQCASS